MVTSLMPLPPGVSPGVRLGTTPTVLVGALNTALAAVTGGRVRRVGHTPMPRSVSLPAVKESALDRDTNAFVRAALVMLTTLVGKRVSISWQTASRFLGWLKAYADVGCGITPAVIADEWDTKGTALLVCGGAFEKYLPAGLELMKQFAGYPADAELEPIFLWIGVVEALRAADAPQPAA